MQQQASALNDGQKKALAEFMAGRPMGSATSGAAENMGFQCRTNPPLADPASRTVVERLEPGPREHALPARGGRAADGGAGAAPEAQMGVRLPLRRVGQRAADRRVGPRLRRQRQRLRLLDRREDGLRLLVVRDRFDHPERDHRSARSTAPATRSTRRLSATATPTSSRSTRRTESSCGRRRSIRTSSRASPPASATTTAR